ncbi:hypothetical protein EAJ17_03610 [Akkermansia sp. aa_0143]|nr:hypothetical protein EAJ17_03610 [Akkermansia sp. aa_0143]
MESQKCAAAPSGRTAQDEGENRGRERMAAGEFRFMRFLVLPCFQNFCSAKTWSGWKAGRFHDGVYGVRERWFRNAFFHVRRAAGNAPSLTEAGGICDLRHALLC